MYDHHWVSRQSVLPATRGNRGCYEMTVTDTDDMKGNWGSGPDTLAQRAQFSDKYVCEPRTTQSHYFSLLIPDDWETKEYWVTLVSMHSKTGSILPWSVHVGGSNLIFDIATLTEGDYTLKGSYNYISLVKEKWYDFRVTSHFSSVPHEGYHTVFCNGVEIADYRGPTLRPDETLGVYFKIGPYVHGDWSGVRYRKIFAMLDSFML